MRPEEYGEVLRPEKHCKVVLRPKERGKFILWPEKCNKVTPQSEERGKVISQRSAVMLSLRHRSVARPCLGVAVILGRPWRQHCGRGIYYRRQ